MGKLMVIAGNSGPFSDFGPYVPSINDRGGVAFFATRRGGATGVFCGDGGPIQTLHQKATFRSHPDINDDETLCVYADLADKSQVVLFGKPAAPPEAVAHEGIPAIGPLGPMINAAGAIAFRATSAAGRAGIYLAIDGELTRLAEAGDRIGGFDGLPVILDDGSVVFRADHADGAQGIHRWRAGGALECVVQTGEAFRELGRFPSANACGTVAFTATRRDGTSGVFTIDVRGSVVTMVESAKVFENFRGALIDDTGRIVFYATPSGGELTIYAMEGPGAAPRRVIGLRDEFGTCPLTDFALNPVSFNNTGQIALRLKLADGRQFIARLDVFG
jgi:hypothetical protein